MKTYNDAPDLQSDGGAGILPGRLSLRSGFCHNRNAAGLHRTLLMRIL